MQRSDICDIFASRQGPFRSFTFSFFEAQLLFVFLVLREEFAFCFRPFPEITLLDRRRRRGAVLSLNKNSPDRGGAETGRSDFIYTKNSAIGRSDCIYTKNSARPRADFLYTKNGGDASENGDFQRRKQRLQGVHFALDTQNKQHTIALFNRHALDGVDHVFF